MSRSRNQMLPSVGVMRPTISLNRVLLPAPFGPIRQCSAALIDAEIQVVDRRDAAKAFRESAGFKQLSHETGSFPP